MIYRHVLNKGVMGVRSPLDFMGQNGFLRPSIPLSELPPTLVERFKEVVNKDYNGDLLKAITAFLKLHDKYGCDKS